MSSAIRAVELLHAPFHFRCEAFRSEQVSFLPACARKKKLVIVSVTSPPRVRKPVLPGTVALPKPSALVSERVICTEAIPGRKFDFQYAKSSDMNFCEFMRTTPKEEVIAFFRDISAEIEDVWNLHDFHMKARDVDSSFRIQVYFNGVRSGPDMAPYMDCIGCSLDTNLFVGQVPGMASKECILEEFSLRPHAVCRLDAKGRSVFSIMPVRHLERMSDLNDEELYALWSVAARLLDHVGISFISLIMNHGSYRSFYHLNLKLCVDDEAHEKFMSALDGEVKQLWYHLQTYAANRPKKLKLCFFFRRDGWCRNGDYCSYLHGK